MNDDLISRQAAIDALCKVGCGSGHCGISCDDVKAIEQLPSAQPADICSVAIDAIKSCAEIMAKTNWERMDSDEN